MGTYTLPRTGDRPVQFEGAIIAETDTQTHQGAGQNRWWKLALYKAASGKFVLAVDYHSHWQGEHESHTVYVSDSGEELAGTARAHPFLAGCLGFPPGHEERQRNLEATLRRCWEGGLSEILAAVGPEIV